MIPVCLFCAPIPLKFKSSVKWRRDLDPNNGLARWTLFSLALHDTRTQLAPVWITVLVRAWARFADGTNYALDWYQMKQGNGGIRCALCASMVVDLVVFVAIYMRGAQGPDTRVHPATLRWLAKVGAAIEFDLYALSD